jgi:hypothetical protein
MAGDDSQKVPPVEYSQRLTPAALRASNFPFRTRIYTVPSAPIAGDDNISSPAEKLHCNAPAGETA